MQTGEFLRAEWRHLAMLNYVIDPELLRPLVPAGTELDTFSGRTFISMVAFLFLNTTVLGVPIPFHRDFEEVNLRFYVRRKTGEGWRRAVVFIKEIVPKFAVALMARSLYNENYESMHMDHRIDLEQTGIVEYRWFFRDEWNTLSMRVDGEAQPLASGSQEEFIAEHYWGYASPSKDKTVEYAVEHPRWLIRRVSNAVLQCNASELYGPEFAGVLGSPPASAFLAEGSEVIVRQGRVL